MEPEIAEEILCQSCGKKIVDEFNCDELASQRIETAFKDHECVINTTIQDNGEILFALQDPNSADASNLQQKINSYDHVYDCFYASAGVVVIPDLVNAQCDGCKYVNTARISEIQSDEFMGMVIDELPFSIEEIRNNPKLKNASVEELQQMGNLREQIKLSQDFEDFEIDVDDIRTDLDLEELYPDMPDIDLNAPDYITKTKDNDDDENNQLSYWGQVDNMHEPTLTEKAAEYNSEVGVSPMSTEAEDSYEGSLTVEVDDEKLLEELGF